MGDDPKMSIVDWCAEEAERRSEDPGLRDGLNHAHDYMVFLARSLDRARTALNEEQRTLRSIEEAAAKHNYDPESETLVEWIENVERKLATAVDMAAHWKRRYQEKIYAND